MNLKYLFPKFELFILKGDDEYIQQGYLLDDQHIAAIPVINNIPYFTKKTICVELCIREILREIKSKMLFFSLTNCHSM